MFFFAKVHCTSLNLMQRPQSSLINSHCLFLNQTFYLIPSLLLFHQKKQLEWAILFLQASRVEVVGAVPPSRTILCKPFDWHTHSFLPINQGSSSNSAMLKVTN